MSRKNVSLILVVGGILILLISIAADLLGIGSYPGLNYAQYGGILIGLVILALGLQRMRVKK